MPVVDANIVVDWVVPGTSSELASVAALDLIGEHDEPIYAPPLLISEVSNALLTKVRQQRMTGPDADAARTVFSSLPMMIDADPIDLDRAWFLARRFDNHPFYDLTYVALAERRGMKLITNDKKLKDRLVGLDFVIAPEDLL